MQTGRGVPVLIPNETNKVLDQPSNLVARQRAIKRPENNYMFANTGEFYFKIGTNNPQTYVNVHITVYLVSDHEY